MSTNRGLSRNQRVRRTLLRLPFAQGARDVNRTSPGASLRLAGPLLQPWTWSVRSALAALVSFEFAFVLFLFAGAMKANPSLAWLPVDMTGLFFALSVIGGAFIVVTKKVNRDGLVIAAAAGAFVTWVIVSFAWTPGVVYAQEKALESVLVFWACAGAAVIIAADRARVRRFLFFVLLIAVWFAIEATVVYAAADKRWYVTLGGTGYNQVGNVVVYGAVIAIVTLISMRRLSPFKWVMAALLPLFFFVLLIVGSRQSLLGLMGVLAVAAVMGFRAVPGIAFNRFQLTVWVILLTGTVAIVIAAAGGESFTVARLSQLLDAEGPGDSAARRLEVMSLAVDFWASAPILGRGVGSFPILARGADVRSHPHNIILEVLCELGLLGLVLFGTFLVLTLRHVKLRRLREDPLFRCIFLLAVFAFGRALVGPDLTENRMLYPLLGLLALPMPAPPAWGSETLGSGPNGEGQPRWRLLPNRSPRQRCHPVRSTETRGAAPQSFENDGETQRRPAIAMPRIRHR